MKRVYQLTLLVLSSLLYLSTLSVFSAEWQGKRSDWKGFQKIDFKVDGLPCYVVLPEKSAEGNPWVWRARFPNYHPEVDLLLLEQGVHVAYIKTDGMLGSPSANKHWDAFYAFMIRQGLSKKVALEAVSRGGLFAYRWAAQNPEKVACIYADTPVCDFKSWPLGQGKGVGAKKEWQNLLKQYGFTEKEALAFKGNPVDVLAPLAEAGVPLLHIVSTNDQIVPVEENSYVLAERYRELGGKIELIELEGTRAKGHHFDHPNPGRCADFVIKSISHSRRSTVIQNAKFKNKTAVYRNIAYGKHARNVLDFWQADGDSPRPLLVYIHGGGWEKGDKKAMRNPDVYLGKGISVASINYRLTTSDPLPAPVHDAARAVQFLRSKAAAWNIDKNNVVLGGGSAGGCSALWIALHDDLADPRSKDPVERESTRVRGAAVLSAQTSIDPKVIGPWIGPKVFLSMIYKAVGENSLKKMREGYARHEATYEEFSPINHLSEDDPPVFLEYPDKPEFMELPAKSFNHGIHHGVFGIKFKQYAAGVGHNKVELFIKSHDESELYKSVDDFIIKTLLSKKGGLSENLSTVIPVPSTLKKFMPKRHLAKLEEAKNNQVDLVMIGDSITHNWEGMKNYASAFKDINLLNLGFAGDRTQNVLWRIHHGALDNISPELVILMIGTNHMHLNKKNSKADSPQDILLGIEAILDEVKTCVPDAKIMLFSVFPRGVEKENDLVNQVNARLPSLADKKKVLFKDMNKVFLTPQGEWNPALFSHDKLHLNAKGYEVWAEALRPVMDAHLKTSK